MIIMVVTVQHNKCSGITTCIKTNPKRLEHRGFIYCSKCKRKFQFDEFKILYHKRITETYIHTL